MTTNEIRSHLDTLKMHIDQLESWMRQATDMVYMIEEKLMDIEDEEIERMFSKKKYTKKCSMETKNAGSELNHYDCPPRLSNACGEHTTSPLGFYQSDLNLNKFIGEKL